jgi:hypothetical protein
VREVLKKRAHLPLLPALRAFAKSAQREPRIFSSGYEFSDNRRHAIQGMSDRDARSCASGFTRPGRFADDDAVDPAARGRRR